MDFETLSNAVDFASRVDTIDTRSLEASRLHRAFLKTDQFSVLRPMQVYSRSVEFAWQRLVDVIVDKRASVVNLFDVLPGDSASKWLWDVERERWLESLLAKAKLLDNGMRNYARSEASLEMFVGNFLTEQLAGCSAFNIPRDGDNTVPYITRINTVIDQMYTHLLNSATLGSKDFVMGALCTLPLGEYGIIVSIAIAAQTLWSQIRDLVNGSKHQPNLQRWLRLSKTQGNATYREVAEIGMEMLALSSTPRHLMTSAVLVLYAGAAASVRNDERINCGAAISLLAQIGTAMSNYLGISNMPISDVLAVVSQVRDFLDLPRDNSELTHLSSIITPSMIEQIGMQIKI